MEPNKLENQIREKLNAREIKPSAQSWDRLDAMLSVEENKKPKRSFRWLFVAASIIGFVLAGLFFFQQEKPSPEIKGNQTVVESNVTKKEAAEKDETFLEPGKKNEKAIVSVKNRKQTVKSNAETIEKQPFVMPEAENKDAIATVQEKEENIKEIMVNPEVLAATDPEKQEEQIQDKPKIKVNASTLLSQVDGEIELTFRQKAIKKISKNLKSARESVASRNRE
ncbi:hypothetical protein [Flavobacterium humi]|uniref:Uncharacterized protein n=1 Tax=Flavobacterium humi TaxID=2562683 RepID=A0A4Z0L7K6_9FLAO|nr:hypothetical protein [Flavobacterium humi]TGD57759.1 hypothetical protein E4635_11320 [Flavobacterium humi]